MLYLTNNLQNFPILATYVVEQANYQIYVANYMDYMDYILVANNPKILQVLQVVKKPSDNSFSIVKIS